MSGIARSVFPNAPPVATVDVGSHSRTRTHEATGRETGATMRVQDQACPVAGHLDPFSAPYLADPYPYFATYRRESPVFYSPEIDHWVVSRHDDVREVFLDPDTFSAANAQRPVTPWPQEAVELRDRLLAAQGVKLESTLSASDPPKHTHVRSFVREPFGPRRIKWLEPRIRELTNDYIDRLVERGGPVDLVHEMLYALPADVLFLFLGIPPSDTDLIKRWSSGRALLTWGNLSDDEVVSQMPSFAEYARYCFDLVDRLAADPGDDYISELLLRFEEEAHDDVTTDTVALILFTLLMAGHETTSNQTANAVRTLLEHEDAWHELHEDPALVPNAVEEVLRIDSSVITWRRLTTRDVTIGDVEVPADSQVLLLLGSANHDEAVFPESDTLDLRRSNARRHTSFGVGIHLCLGAPLARLELKVYLEELTRRLPALRMVTPQEIAYHRNTSHRGPDSLWVTW